MRQWQEVQEVLRGGGVNRLALLLFLLGAMLLLAGLGALFHSANWINLLMPLLGSVIVSAGALTMHRSVQQHRQERALRRARTGTGEATTALTDMLLGSYKPYVVEAAQALGELGDPGAVPALVAVMERAFAEQRPGWEEVAIAAALAMGRLEDARALPALGRLISAADPEVRAAAADALRRVDARASYLRTESTPQSEAETLVRPETTAGPQHLLRPGG